MQDGCTIALWLHDGEVSAGHAITGIHIRPSVNLFYYRCSWPTLQVEFGELLRMAEFQLEYVRMSFIVMPGV